MKETGIIMSGDHPKLVLDGRKTQTRRAINHHSIPNSDIVGFQEFLYIPNSKDEMLPAEGYYALLKCNANQNRSTIYFKCPYGQVGDRLWVRETWAMEPVFDNTKPNHIYEILKPKKPLISYLAGNTIILNQGFTVSTILDYGIGAIGRNRPSIFMPRWASRILLEITEVRAERLQEITEEDALAEGIKVMQGTWQATEKNGTGKLRLVGEPQPYTAKYHFEALWNSLNTKRGYGWEVNPWVWVISFKVLSQ